MTEKTVFEPRRRARRRALQALYQWGMTGQQPTAIVRQFFEMQDMKNVDRDYFESLVLGVTSAADTLDSRLEPFLDRPIAQLERMELAALRIGAYELLHRPEVPWRVVVDESVDLAHRFGSVQGHNYVNAVLDKAARKWRAGELAQSD